MGAVASVFEAIARRCPENTPDPWTMDINEQRRLVVATRRVLGLDWSYKVDCNVHDNNQLRTTPDRTATYRDATIITIPEAQASSIGGKITEFFESPGASDLSIQGQTICPQCAADITITMCDWTLLPCTSGNAPDRLFFRSAGVFTGNYGQSPTPSLSLTFGTEYIPLWASHLIFLSGYQRSETTALHSSGQEGACLSTTASMEVSLPRHLSLILPGTKRPFTWLFILKLLGSSPRQPHLKVILLRHRARPRGIPTTGTTQGRCKTSRTAHLEEMTDEPAFYRYICPLSPSGRMEHDDY